MTEPEPLDDIVAATINLARRDAEIATAFYERLVTYRFNIPAWAWRAATATTYATGLYFGYPPCCIAQFCSEDEPLADHDHDYDNDDAAEHEAREARRTRRFDAQKRGKVEHVPCDRCTDRILEGGDPHPDAGVREVQIRLPLQI